jgi:hypothetical protein
LKAGAGRTAEQEECFIKKIFYPDKSSQIFIERSSSILQDAIWFFVGLHVTDNTTSKRKNKLEGFNIKPEWPSKT